MDLNRLIAITKSDDWDRFSSLDSFLYDVDVKVIPGIQISNMKDKARLGAEASLSVPSVSISTCLT